MAMAKIGLGIKELPNGIRRNAALPAMEQGPLGDDADPKGSLLSLPQGIRTVARVSFLQGAKSSSQSKAT